MHTFRSILFPTDFSECSERVFPYALDMSQKFDSRLHLLHVVRDISYLVTMNVESVLLMKTASEIALAGEAEMQAFCGRHMTDFSNYEAKVVIGNSEEEILRYADEVSSDLIIMGTHGRKGLGRVLMGSVAYQVLQNASVPVLTVNPFMTKVVCVHGKEKGGSGCS